MAKLSAKSRGKLPKGEFGEPGKRAYPMPDKSHAANAKARASQAEAMGNLPSGAKARIDAKADRILGQGAGVKTGAIAPEDKGHQLPGQPGHYRYK